MTNALAVVDASVVAAWLLPDEDGSVADELLSGIADGVSALRNSTVATATPWAAIMRAHAL